MFRKFLCILCILFCFQVNANEEEVKKFIEQLTNEAIQIIKTVDVERSIKANKLESLFIKYVDTDWMSRFVLGRYYRTIDENQKEQFRNLYRDYLISSYVPKFEEYTGEVIKINEISKKNDNMFLVKTIIDRTGEQDFEVNYLIMKLDNYYKIIDIIAEGVSLINSNRSEFSSVISNKSFDNLVTLLKKKK